MKQAYVRRGDLLRCLSKDDVTLTMIEAHNKLLEQTEILWDAVFPVEAREWIIAMELTPKDEPGYIVVGFIDKGIAVQCVKKWTEIIEAAGGSVDIVNEVIKRRKT